MIVDAIYAAIKRQKDSQDIRLSRIGASYIGTSCLRSIFYSWRTYSTEGISGRIHRLFETGHLQEERIVADLRAAGFSVWDKDENDYQFTFTDVTGHLVCKVDGIIKHDLFTAGESTVLEIKTHSKKSFTELMKKGMALSKPEHYYQVQTGMLLSGIPRALYVALCKDDEQYYVEHVEPDKTIQDDIEQRVKTLVTAEYLPARISEDCAGWTCTYCKHLDVCANKAPPLKHCRSCRNLCALAEGEFGCTLTGEVRNYDEQLKGCEEYDARV